MRPSASCVLGRFPACVAEGVTDQPTMSTSPFKGGATDSSPSSASEDALGLLSRQSRAQRGKEDRTPNRLFAGAPTKFCSGQSKC